MRAIAVLALFPLSLAAGEEGREAAAPPSVQIPHIAMTPYWRTLIRVLNPMPGAQEVRLELFSPQGTAAEAIIDGASASGKSVLLGGYAQIEIEVKGSLDRGYGVLTFLSGMSLPHTVLYESALGHRGAVAKAAKASYSSSYFQFDNTQGGRTGVVFLVRESSSELAVKLTCFHANGGPMGSYVLPVAKGAVNYLLRQLTLELPAALPGASGVRGTCHFSYYFPASASRTEYPASYPSVSMQLRESGMIPLSN